MFFCTDDILRWVAHITEHRMYNMIETTCVPASRLDTVACLKEVRPETVSSQTPEADDGVARPLPKASHGHAWIVWLRRPAACMPCQEHLAFFS
jgi:hypothetical protein